MEDAVRAVLVTGAQGLLGRHLVAGALRRWPGARVVGVGRSSRADTVFTHTLTWVGAPVPAPVPGELVVACRDPRYSYVAVDLCDRERLERLVADTAPDVVLHAAAALRDEPWERLVASNLDATVAVVAAAARLPRRPAVLVVSSGSVYGQADGDPPYDESACAVPDGSYGATKRAAEDAARVLARDAGIPLTVARAFNLVGPALQERHLPARLAGEIAAIVAGLGVPRLETGPLTTTRDFVDVRDAAEACLMLADRRHDGVVNVASGVETHVADIVDLLLAAAGLDGAVEVATTRPARRVDLPRSVADVRRLREAGVPPGRPLAATLDDMLRYYLSSYAP